MAFYHNPHKGVSLLLHEYRGHLPPCRPEGVYLYYSMISSTALFLIFFDAAVRIVLSALAVLPCFPITFPRSSLATVSSITDDFSPSTSFTLTCSGWSTSALAICSIS